MIYRIRFYPVLTKNFTINLGQAKAIEFHTDHDKSNWKVKMGAEFKEKPQATKGTGGDIRRRCQERV